MRAKGEIVYLFIYDVAEEIDVARIDKVMDKLPKSVALEYRRIMPRYISIEPAPIFIDVGRRRIEVFGRDLQAQIQSRIYAVGAISIAIRMPFEGDVEDLVEFSSEFTVKYQEQEWDLRKISKVTVQEIVRSIESLVIPVPRLDVIPEEYSIFCISEAEGILQSEDFVGAHRSTIAAILRGEKNVDRISEDEIKDALKYSVSYFKRDIVLIDWSSTLLFEPSGEYEDQLMTLELANLQLLELRSYDAYIDEAIEKAYDDIRKLTSGSVVLLITGGPQGTVMEMAETRMELEKSVESTMNIMKLFGDWYLGRIYSCSSERLHLKEWEDTVMRKLDTLEDLYSIASDNVESRRYMVLESIFVIIVALDLALRLIGLIS